MRALGGLFAALILALQFPLWLGKGGWLRVWEVNRQLEEQIARNGGLEVRNGSLAAEVNDLKRGLDAVEERARFELGMVRHDEVFFQFTEDPSQRR